MFAGLFSSPVLRGLFFCTVCLMTVLLSSRAYPGGSAPERYSVAMRNFGVWEPATRERLDFSVWYPSRAAASDESVREGWVVEYSQRGRILPGFYPVVLVSHDTSSGRFANNDLAAAIASGGMIVIVPSHTDDNQNSSDGIYTARLLRERPRHLLRALETVLDTPDFALHADESRIGLLGVGFGCISVMQLAGAQPDFTRLQGYCGAASGQDAFCSPWTKERLARISDALPEMYRKDGAASLCPPLDLFAPELMAVAIPESSPESEAEDPPAAARKRSLWQRIFGGGHEEEQAEPFPGANGTIQASDAARQPETQNATMAFDFRGDTLFGGIETNAGIVPIALPDSPQFRFSVAGEPTAGTHPEAPLVTIDPAVRAYRRLPGLRKIRGLALVAPAGGMLFSREAMAGIHVPVAVVEAGQDSLYPPRQHSSPYFANLPVQPLMLQLPEADHFSLFARCARDTMINLGDICGRLVGDDREDLERKRDAFLVPFFQSALGGPLPPAPPSGYVAVEPEGQ